MVRENLVRYIARLGLLASALMIVGCSSPFRVDDRLAAVSQDSRVQFLILHFTAEDLPASLRYLTQGPVSSHYLVTDENPPRVLQLVDESKRAYHAGHSSWGPNAAGINAASIGIEIVNLGSRVAGYQDYPSAQMDVVLNLSREIIRRHGIHPTRVLGHSDIAPQRKDDPGPKFPWKRFAEKGLIAWPDAHEVATMRHRYERELPSMLWFQQRLSEVGYAVPHSGVQDAETTRVLAAFQMRFRPARYDGSPDAETAALVEVMSRIPKP